MVVFPKGVFPYLGAQPLREGAGGVLSPGTPDGGAVKVSAHTSNGESLPNRSSDKNECGGERRVAEGRCLSTGATPDSLLAHLDESCRLHYDIDALQRLIGMLCQGVAEQYLLAYSDDNAYLMGKEVSLVMRQWAATASHGGFSATSFALANHARLDLLAQAVPCIQAVAHVLAYHHQFRLAGMALEPRVVRVGRRLDMSAKEIETLTFILLCHCGALLGASIGTALTPSTVAYHTGLGPKELMWFFVEHRRHVKQGLVTSDIRHRSGFVDSHVAMPQEVVTTLTGDDLSEEQLVKLEHTALAEVLSEEKINSVSRVFIDAAITPSTVVALGERKRSYAVSRRSRTTSPQLGTFKGDGHLHGAQRRQRREEEEEGSTGFASGTDVSSEAEDGTEGGDHVMGAAGVNGSLVLAARHADGVAGEGEGDNASCHDSRAVSNAAPADKGERSGGANQKANADRIVAVVPPSNGEGECCSNNGGGGSFFSSGLMGSGDSNCAPYKSDFEYMEAAFNLLTTLIKIRTAVGDIKDDEDCYQPKTRLEATLRELKGRQRVSTAVHSRRVQATLAMKSGDGGYVPRIEQLSQRLCLTDLEKQIMLLMVGNVVSHDILIAINGRNVMRDGQRVLTVGFILFVLCESLQERIAARRSFYRASPLLSSHILSLSLDISGRSRFNTDLMDYMCDIDRKIVDYLMGTETETAEMVPGSSLYFPTASLSNVVLPQQTSELVLSTIEHYSLFEQCKRTCSFGEGLGSSSNGLVILFYGPSGTGKTLLANAIAHKLGKRILLVNVSVFRADKNAAEMMRFIFRESKLSDNAIIFFDECESLFETRETNPLVTSLLSDFEKHDGLIIMATNKAQNIDEAMNRRISLMVEFKLPGHEMRESIWRRHLPPGLKLQPDVSLEKLALNYELSGGLIRNAMLAALHHAVAREKTATPSLCMEDMESGAKQQLRGFFMAAELPQGMASPLYVTPKRTLGELVLDDKARKQVEAIATAAKGRSTLFLQWGFSEDVCEDQGTVHLFSGPSGTGKSLAAEGIAFDCGAAIRLCNVAELMLMQELNVRTVFEEARKLNAIIVFDQAQELFNYSERSASVSQLIQYHARRYPRPIIVIATTSAGTDGDGVMVGGGSFASCIDVRTSRLVFSQHVVFRLPSQEFRKELWAKAFPAKVPLAADVNYGVLSETVVSAKTIRAVAFNVCCRVALLPESRREVSMAVILHELESAVLRERGRKPSTAMYA